jgi:serine/threonine protein kinase
MAPEVIKKQEFTKKSDVYGFGMIMYELLSRRKLYEGFNSLDVFEKMEKEDNFRIHINKNDILDIDLYNLILDCWNQHPFKRPSFIDIINRINNIF